MQGGWLFQRPPFAEPWVAEGALKWMLSASGEHAPRHWPVRGTPAELERRPLLPMRLCLMAFSAKIDLRKPRIDGGPLPCSVVQRVGEIERRDVWFPARDGTRLEGWLYLPSHRSGPLPAITMANGFAATRWHGVNGFALAFAHAGFAVLLHDHRNFGTSGGGDRGDVDPWRQVSDWEDAISYLRSRPEVLAHRIGLWGTGYAGGHALILGATDRQLRAVVSQVPVVNGMSRVEPGASNGCFLEDCRQRLAGGPGLRLALASADPAMLAPYRSPEAIAFYCQPDAAGMWENDITVRSLRARLSYVPGAWVERVTPTPLMLMVASDDVCSTEDPKRASGGSAVMSREVVTLQGGPFSPFGAQFTRASATATRWFSDHV